MEIKGVVIAIVETEKGTSKSTGKDFSIGGFVIKTGGEHSKKIAFKTVNKEFEEVGLGNEVNVHFNAESREYNGRYYTDLSAWKVEGLAVISQAANIQEASDGSDGLPF